ncbi:TRAP transporter small permease [Endozoicomonas arenosclerae]|uniref:TRAP transporter small permease n=1 Tax=Endozoicomonas arenosclerae TaxID=1633495 RepID=UPI000781654F|nr:TRAP transporter small permease [Endozoicomonas arenosclerae]
MNIEKIKHPVDRLLAILTTVSMITLVLAVLWQAISRFLPFTTPSTWTEELARHLMLAVAMLGAAYTTGLKKHLAINLISGKLTGQKKRLADLLFHASVALFAFLTMMIGGSLFALRSLSLGQMAPGLDIPIGTIYLVVPLAGCFIVFYSLLFITECFSTNQYQTEAKSSASNSPIKSALRNQ